MELDKDRVRDILDNWRRWSKDCPPDPAEVHYYTTSPDFRDYVKPNPSGAPYDNDSALMVEEVFREMFTVYPMERETLIVYYDRDYEATAEDVADGMGISRRLLFYRLGAARRAFSEVWLSLLK